MIHSPVKGGAAYFTVVFVVAFALGILRTLVVAPRWGATIAVLLEAPALLAFSWVACGAIVKAVKVPADGVSRVLMGTVAFGLLMMAEFGFGAVLGRPPTGQIKAFATTPCAIGLAAQVGFALVPLIRSIFDRSE